MEVEVELGAVEMAVVVIRPCRSGEEFAHIAIQSYGGIVAADSTLSGIGVVSELCRACLRNRVPQQGLSERLFATVGL